MGNTEAIDIINKVKSGELSVEEAARRLELLKSGSVKSPGQPGTSETPADWPAFDPAVDEIPSFDPGWWQHAWLIPLGIGTIIIIFSAALLSWSTQAESLFWFYCSWLPLLFGLLVLMLGVWSRQARWAHVRVNSSDGTRISVSSPIPARFAGWVLRILIPLIPALREKHLDTLPPVLDALADSNEPIFVDVDDKDGDKVRVYIL